MRSKCRYQNGRSPSSSPSSAKPEAEPADEEHSLSQRISDGEYLVTVDHPMEKGHYISFIASASDGSVQLAKKYPEGSPEARFRIDGAKWLYFYCNRHGLFRAKPGK